MNNKENLTGKDLIHFIQQNHLEDSILTVTATIYSDGEHECKTTNKISFYKDRKRINGQYVDVINLYVDNDLY